MRVRLVEPIGCSPPVPTSRGPEPGGGTLTGGCRALGRAGLEVAAGAWWAAFPPGGWWRAGPLSAAGLLRALEQVHPKAAPETEARSCNAMRIQHPAGIRTLHARNSGLFERASQAVTADQQVARAGDSCGSTGPHLHFKVLVDGRNVIPSTWLRDRGGAV